MVTGILKFADQLLQLYDKFRNFQLKLKSMIDENTTQIGFVRIAGT